MSARVRVPPRTRFEVGQEMNSGLRSIRNTSIAPSLHMRRYFAAVAPPKPPPTTITRPIGFDGTLGWVTQPDRREVAAAAPEAFRNSRRLTRLIVASYLAFCAEKYAASASICSSLYPFAI